jgi:Putative auto-transporter adhesin, head GIN domain
MNMPVSKFLKGSGLLILLFVSLTFIQSKRLHQETREVDFFDKITVAGSFNIELVRGEQSAVVLKGENLNKVKTEVKENTLTISCDGNCSQVNIRVQVPELYKMEIAGSSIIKSVDAFGGGKNLDLIIAGSGIIHTGVAAENLKASIAGSGKMECTGSATNSTVDIAGSGVFDAGQLQNQQVKVNIAGSGNASVHASETAMVDIAGNGTVDVYGNPKKMKKNIQGNGQVNSK